MFVKKKNVSDFLPASVEGEVVSQVCGEILVLSLSKKWEEIEQYLFA